MWLAYFLSVASASDAKVARRCSPNAVAKETAPEAANPRRLASGHAAADPSSTRCEPIRLSTMDDACFNEKVFQLTDKPYAAIVDARKTAPLFI
jgi:hypothetical protein